MEADLEELALVEADLTKLEQKVNDLGIRLNLQHKGNCGSALNLCNKPQQISNQEAKLYGYHFSTILVHILLVLTI